MAIAWHYQQVDVVSAACMRSLRILLAEDVAMVRGALVALIELEPDMKVVAAIERGDYIVSQTLAHHPDVAIIDIDLPGLDGLSAAAQLHDVMPECRVLILTNLGRAGALRRALAAHVSGYMLKDAPRAELLHAVRAAAQGQAVLSPAVTTRLMSRVRTPGTGPLSQRELEVLELVAAGNTNREAAARLFITEATVKTHLLNIYAKLGVGDRAAAVAEAFKRGLLTSGSTERP